MKPMNVIPTVIPGLTPDRVRGRLRDPVPAADLIPAFAGIACPGLDPGTGTIQPILYD
jgi:hypothetical protein